MGRILSFKTPLPFEGEETKAWQLACLAKLERGLAWRFLSPLSKIF
jgi:hypothetical protein